MAFRRCNISVGLDELLGRTTELDITGFYLNIHTLPALINSPVRQDRNASVSVFSPDGIKVFYKDFGTGEHGSIFDLLGKMWNRSFNEVVSKIWNDLNSVNPDSIRLNKTHKGAIRRTDSVLQVRTRQWFDYDMEYWNSYGITREWLEFGDVYPISHILITRDNHTKVIPADRLAYVYVERKDNKVSLKVYQPKSQRLKWLSKHDSSVWDLWSRLPEEGDTLFITSSRKDALCLWENTGIPSVSLQGEGYIPKEKVINQLKRRFKRIIIFFDNDFDKEENHGHIYASRLCGMFDLEMVEIPSEYQSKDPSDLFKNKGSETFRRVIKELLVKSIKQKQS